jgi:hypothetical protein
MTDVPLTSFTYTITRVLFYRPTLLNKQAAGYDTGLDADKIDGEAVVAVLTALSQEAVVAGGPKRMAEMVGGCDDGFCWVGVVK